MTRALPRPGLAGPRLSSTVPYPPRPQLRPLPEFAGTARTGTIPSRQLQDRLEAYVVASYREEGRSLREIVELVDRSQTAVRRILEAHQVPRRLPGAPRATADQR